MAALQGVLTKVGLLSHTASHSVHGLRPVRISIRQPLFGASSDLAHHHDGLAHDLNLKTKSALTAPGQASRLGAPSAGSRSAGAARAGEILALHAHLLILHCMHLHPACAWVTLLLPVSLVRKCSNKASAHGIDSDGGNSLGDQRNLVLHTAVYLPWVIREFGEVAGSLWNGHEGG
jgi:hypothetical protein